MPAVAIERLLASGEHVRSVFCVFTAKTDFKSPTDWLFRAVARALVSVLILIVVVVVRVILLSKLLFLFNRTQKEDRKI